MENAGRFVLPDGYIPKEDAAELIGRHPRTLEKIWRRSQRTDLKIRKKLVRPVKGGSAEAAYHREDLLRFMAAQSRRRPGQSSNGLQPDIAKLSDLVRSEAERIIAELRNIKLHVEFGGRKNDNV
jgi:hypothetical protein